MTDRQKTENSSAPEMTVNGKLPDLHEADWNLTLNIRKMEGNRFCVYVNGVDSKKDVEDYGEKLYPLICSTIKKVLDTYPVKPQLDYDYSKPSTKELLEFMMKMYGSEEVPGKDLIHVLRSRDSDDETEKQILSDLLQWAEREGKMDGFVPIPALMAHFQ